MNSILIMNKRLDEIQKRHQDTETTHDLNQVRQLLDDLFTNPGCPRDCVSGDRPECRPEQG